MWRRAALAFLRMPGEELFGKIDADHENAVVFAVAQVRIEIGLCNRNDYDEVLAEAKIERKASKRLSRRNAAGVAHG